MWKTKVERDRPQTTIWRMRIACWVLKATNTHSQYVTLTAFPPQQWLHEHASMPRYTYISCLIVNTLRNQCSTQTVVYSRLHSVICVLCG
jgi:hypothetical protein